VSVATDTLAQEAQGTAARTPVVLPCVNLLPPEIAERRRATIVKMRLGGVVVAAAAVVGLVYFQVAGGVAPAQDRLDAAQAQSTTLQRQIAALSNVTKTQKELDAAKAAVSKALGNEVRWSRYLNDLSITLPSNIWVTNVAIAENGVPTAAAGSSAAATTSATAASANGLGTLTIQGDALSFNDVAVWLETLAKEKGYTNAWLSQGTTQQIGDQNVIQFTSTVTFTPDVLSQRYTQAGN
jgi:Tfp pilus assembly protein PilN